MTHIERLQQHGIRRTRTGKRSFMYQTAAGSKVRAADVARINALRIPPAWTEVAINPAPNGRLQAIGKDAAGRWQYLYHADHVRKQERKKFERVIHFGTSLPALRQTVSKHLRQPGLSRERVLACILKTLSMSFLRPGSEIYANEHGSYGITTLRSKHVKARGDLVILDFAGKSGVQQHHELRNPQIAKTIKELLKRPGRRVFRYESEDNGLVNVTPRHINAYIREVMGDRFSAKDFRTWAGTLICACELAHASANGNGDLPVQRRLRSAIEATAKALGNTPAVCRSSYVCPSIIQGFEKGQVISCRLKAVDELLAFRGASLHPAEKALLRFLKNGDTT